MSFAAFFPSLYLLTSDRKQSSFSSLGYVGTRLLYELSIRNNLNVLFHLLKGSLQQLFRLTHFHSLSLPDKRIDKL